VDFLMSFDICEIRLKSDAFDPDPPKVIYGDNFGHGETIAETLRKEVHKKWRLS